MNREQRTEAVFGAWDGVVSVTGFILGLVIHHSPESAIAVGGLGGAIAAAISMSTGELEKDGGSWLKRLPVVITMFLASLGGSLIPVIGFFFLSESAALLVAAIGCFAVASVIGWLKHKGIKGYIGTYVVLLVAVGVTLGVVSAIPFL